MCAVYRGERWELSYGVESVYGAAPTGAMTATQLFGVFDDATLPDPTFEHQPWWMMNPDSRNYYVAYKGRARSEGSIPNVMLIDGRPLFLPISKTITHTGSSPAFVHTINETIELPSIRVVAANYEDADASPGALVRWFVGGKVNRATYQCTEGGMLMMSLDDVSFKMPYFKDIGTTTALLPWYDADAVKQTLDYPCTEPYYFSQSTIKMKLPSLGMVETTVNSIRSFRLDVNNNLEPKYYLATNAEKVPYEIREGRRNYRLAMQVDLVDMAAGWTKDTPFLELLGQGMDTTVFRGAAIEITFTRGADDYIKFITPADYTPECGDSQGSLIVRAPTNIATEGLISVPMEMICRNLKIVVGDSIAGANYPV
jgi:hypothetical protein